MTDADMIMYAESSWKKIEEEDWAKTNIGKEIPDNQSFALKFRSSRKWTKFPSEEDGSDCLP